VTIVKQESDGPSWKVVRINTFEGLDDLFPHAQFETIKLTANPVNAVKALGAQNGATVIGCTINGKVAIRGLMPTDSLTIEVGLRCGPGNLQWLRPVQEGSVLSYPAGSEYDSVIDGPVSSLFCTVPEEYLHQAAARIGVSLPSAAFSQSCLYPVPLERESALYLNRVHQALVGNGDGERPSPGVLAEALVGVLIKQAGLLPQGTDGTQDINRYNSIVRRSREWIEAHLDQKITIDQIAAAAATSRRTLHRAFNEVLGESPKSYVLQLRLHRIQRELRAKSEAVTTVAAVANHWEISELGRLSARYRALFGELPSQTLARKT
jgi:AraC-like DNA-binding protein